ncbi:YcxB family protein [Tissierella praeacuta]|uniref:YcxB family protein n=1 Tax=Tissierella praeacuta TaxID=43131 RepID=UPI002FDAF83B
MQITYNITQEDQKKYISSSFISHKKHKFKVISIIVIIVLSFSFILALTIKEYFHSIIALILLALNVFIYHLNPKRFKKKYIRSLKNSGILEETRIIDISDNELKFSSSLRTVIHQYSDIKNISIINDYFIVISFKHEDSIAIPKSAFSNDIEMIDFINKIKTNAKIL